MLDKLLEKFESWATRWQAWVFAPKSLYPRDRNTIRPLTFFIANVSLAYVLALLTTFAFLVIEHQSLVQAAIQKRVAGALALTSGMYLAYLVATFVSFFVGSVVSFFGYRLVKTKVQFKDHLQLFLELTFAEPLFVVAVSLALLIWPPSPISTSDTLSVVSIVLGARLWSYAVSYHALKGLHMLPANSHRTAFATAHLFAVLLVGVLGTLVGWLVLVSLVAGWE